jgi:hypothetical protein
MEEVKGMTTSPSQYPSPGASTIIVGPQWQDSGMNDNFPPNRLKHKQRAQRVLAAVVTFIVVMTLFLVVALEARRILKT